ncbi:hypothetical protein Dimus_035659 [Dionaea muscipula]
MLGHYGLLGDVGHSAISSDLGSCPILRSEKPPCGVTTRQMSKRKRSEKSMDVAPGAIMAAISRKGVSNARRQVLSRSTAMNLVSSSIGLSSSNNECLQGSFWEAKICWKISKDLGLASNMDDDEVVSKFQELEDQEVVKGCQD